jgi:hypothetical protein
LLDRLGRNGAVALPLAVGVERRRVRGDHVRVVRRVVGQPLYARPLSRARERPHGQGQPWLERERQFRKIIGYRHLAGLAVAVERHVTAERANLSMTTPTDPAATLATVS